MQNTIKEYLEYEEMKKVMEDPCSYCNIDSPECNNCRLIN